MRRKGKSTAATFLRTPHEYSTNTYFDTAMVEHKCDRCYTTACVWQNHLPLCTCTGQKCSYSKHVIRKNEMT